MANGYDITCSTAATNYTAWSVNTGGSYVLLPASPVVVPKPEPESNLAWLRRQVAEVCEEAWAA